MIQKVKGTQDILKMDLWNLFIERASKYLRKNSFIQINTPILEPTELFKRSLGLETDVISKQMYTVNTHDDESISLRPEMTASVMRAFLNNNIIDVPWKIFSWGPIFRYERPQKGRFRQFNQLTIEILDTNSVDQDIFFIATINNMLESEFKIFEHVLELYFLACRGDRDNLKVNLYKELLKHDLCDTCVVRRGTNILRVFDCKNDDCQKVYETVPNIIDFLCLDCQKEWQYIKNSLEILSVSFVHKKNLVRGLDYYDKIVFEFTSNLLGSQSTFCGGGRYNSLSEQLGSTKSVPSIGAAFGVERVAMILEEIQDKLIKKRDNLIVIIPVEAEQRIIAMLIAQSLTDNEFDIEIYLENNSLKSMMRKANKDEARFAIIIGKNEQETNTLLVKDMCNSEQTVVSQADILKYLSSFMKIVSIREF